MVFENASLQKQHGLLYLELSHAMNHGDVGRILRILPYWIAIFKSTGKSKYAAHMIRFITDLDHVYPKCLK
jgi:aminoglycoside/choline kinase family phosphotransferase